MNRVAEMAAICMHMKHKSACSSNGIMELAEQQAVAVKKKILQHAESYYTWELCKVHFHNLCAANVSSYMLNHLGCGAVLLDR